MNVRFLAIAVLLLSTYSIHAQFSKNFAAYVGYAIVNEPNITFEYRVHKRIAVNLEGAAFIPLKKEQNLQGILSPTKRLNCTGGSIRTGISIYGKNRFGIMHRVMADISYVSSGLYRETSGTSYFIGDDYYQQYMQYGVFYEFTVRLFASQKRHHLFVRAGIAARTINRYTIDREDGMGNHYPVTQSHEFYTAPGALFSIGYRIRLHPQKDYFVGE